MSLLQVSANPAYRLDPAKLAAELLKGQRYDPKRVQYTEAEYQQLTQAKADPVNEAKAKLLEAQTKKAAAETTQTNVTAMFSATSAAEQIALNPAIAAPADGMLMSAGFVDANAAPVIPPIQQDVPVVDDGLPENTSPNFPPRIQSPDVGVDSGIEGGN